jgi:hypothetical protein
MTNAFWVAVITLRAKKEKNQIKLSAFDVCLHAVPPLEVFLKLIRTGCVLQGVFL